jgi:hypothetical protein
VQTDAFGQFFVQHSTPRHVELAADGSAQVQVRGGASIQVRPTDHAGNPLMFPSGGIFTGEMLQREAVQFYPGEHVRQAMPRAFFNPLCGGCHGSISGRELDTAVDIDVLTRASPSILSLDEMPVDTR